MRRAHHRRVFGSLPITKNTLWGVRESRIPTEASVAAARQWAADYAEDRRRRGIPPEGLRPVNGVAGLLAQRQLWP